jgi:hypothetical protein
MELLINNQLVKVFAIGPNVMEAFNLYLFLMEKHGPDAEITKNARDEFERAFIAQVTA